MKLIGLFRSISILFFTLIGAQALAQNQVNHELKSLQDLNEKQIQFLMNQPGVNQSNNEKFQASGNWVTDRTAELTDDDVTEKNLLELFNTEN